MKEDKLLKALSDINDEFILEAGGCQEDKTKIRKRKPVTILALAAVLLLTLTIGVFAEETPIRQYVTSFMNFDAAESAITESNISEIVEESSEGEGETSIVAEYEATFTADRTAVANDEYFIDEKVSCCPYGAESGELTLWLDNIRYYSSPAEAGINEDDLIGHYGDMDNTGCTFVLMDAHMQCLNLSSPDFTDADGNITLWINNIAEATVTRNPRTEFSSGQTAYLAYFSDHNTEDSDYYHFTVKENDEKHFQVGYMIDTEHLDYGDAWIYTTTNEMGEVIENGESFYENVANYRQIPPTYAATDVDEGPVEHLDPNNLELELGDCPYGADQGLMTLWYDNIKYYSSPEEAGISEEELADIYSAADSADCTFVLMNMHMSCFDMMSTENTDTDGNIILSMTDISNVATSENTEKGHSDHTAYLAYFSGHGTGDDYYNLKVKENDEGEYVVGYMVDTEQLNAGNAWLYMTCRGNGDVFDSGNTEENHISYRQIPAME